MSFLHPWAVGVGAAALALPVLIHWLTRPRPARMPLSTVRLVQELIVQRRARNRIRDFVILALRVAAVGLLAVAIGRPLLGARSQAASDSSAEVIRIIVIDGSQSMAASDGGIEPLERARPIAARHLAFRPGLAANVLVLGARPYPVFDRPSANLAALRDEIAQVKVRPERGNVQLTLNEAAEMLTASGGESTRRELILISDFQRTNWASADLSVLPKETQIQMEAVSPETTPDNYAITRVGAQGRVERGQPFRFEVEVGNFSKASKQLTAEATFGEALIRVQGECPAGRKAVLSGEAIAPAIEWMMGDVRLSGVEDAIPGDNVRPAVIAVHAPIRIILLTRQSRQEIGNSVYYLTRGLFPEAGQDKPREERIEWADPLKLDRDRLAAADIILLDHPGKLDADAIRTIADLLNRGHGVFYVASEPVDAANLKLLVTAAGNGLQMPVEFAPPTRPRKDLFLAELNRKQSLFSIFGDGLNGLFGTIRFSGGLASRRLDGGLPDDVLASFNDLSAALVLTSSGAGTLAVLNADLADSNLPASPAFVPLLGELQNRLLSRDRGASEAGSGEPFAAYLPVSARPASSLKIVAPDGVQDAGELRDEGAGVLWQSPYMGPPGIYRVERGTEPVYAAASTIPAEESELETLGSDVLQQRLAGGRTVRYRSALSSEESNDDLWKWFTMACLACVLAELCSLRAFRA